MGRTLEMILTFIGVIIHGFFTVIGGFIVWMYHNEEKVVQMLEDVEEEESELSTSEFLQLLNEIGESGWYMAIGSAVALIMGVVAIYFLRGDQNAKVAGYILIITAVLTTIGSLGGAAIGGIIYFITGLICFFRKPKEHIPLSLNHY